VNPLLNFTETPHCVAGEYAIGQFFMPNDAELRQRVHEVIEKVAKGLDMPVLGWRTVPTDNAMLGDGARSTEPVIEQVRQQPRHTPLRLREPHPCSPTRAPPLLPKVCRVTGVSVLRSAVNRVKFYSNKAQRALAPSSTNNRRR
jgi:hypothetical protein